MAKVKSDSEKAIGREAVILTATDHSQIRRRGQLRALKSRVEYLIERLDEKLNPKIDAELSIDGPDCTKANVLIGLNLVELAKTKRNTPLYKDIAAAYISIENLAKAIADEKYLSKSTTYRTKLLGRVSPIGSLLPPLETPKEGKRRAFNFAE
jgi:hypothetical protein